MDITRRHFLLGTAGAAAGLILPSYYRRALEFIDARGAPLLEPAPRPVTELLAYRAEWTELQYGLSVGPPRGSPPPMTYEQFADRYNVDPVESLYGWEDDFKEFEKTFDWDAKVNWENEFFWETWMERDAPQKLAYELLRNLDLGPQLAGPNAVGELKVEEGSTMVSTYWEVEAADDISLSLLQERLNALKTGVKIVMA